MKQVKKGGNNISNSVSKNIKYASKDIQYAAKDVQYGLKDMGNKI